MPSSQRPSFPAAPPPASGAAVDLGIAVLSRWPILDHAQVAMPARHRAWDPLALTVRVDHPAGPLPLVATCMEPGVAYSDDRVAQAALLADLVTDPSRDGPCPVLLLGDLNAASDAPVLRPIADVLVDAWADGHGDADAVTLPSTHPSATMEVGPQLIDQRIDHVFFRAGHENQHVLVERVGLAGDAVAGVIPSDHRAVFAELRWRN